MSEARLLLRLAWRTLWRNRRRTEITLSSIALGLALSIVINALGEGVFEHAVKDATRLLAGELTVESPGYADDPGPALALSHATELRVRLEELPGVVRVRPSLTVQAVASSGGGAAGVALLGVDPAAERGHSLLEEKRVEGRGLDPAEPRGALIGKGLARRLRLAPGKKLVLTTTDAQGNVSGELFRVAGIFRLGSDELDTLLVQAPLPLVQKLVGLRPDQVGQLGLFLAEGSARERVRAEVVAAAGPSLAVRTWEEALPAIAAWISVDRRSNLFTRALHIFIVTFTILNTLLMSVLERGHEFAVLLALGTPRSALRAQVLFEVALLALVGCTLGATLGAAFVFWARGHGIDLSGWLPANMSAGGMAFDPVLHPKLSGPAIARDAAVVFFTTLLLGLWPMRRAGRAEIAASLRTQR